jgi:hypothetical protein
MNFPKWKYRKHPTTGEFQSTLVGTPEAEAEIGPTWTDDPKAHGVAVVPYPAELAPDGTLLHHQTQADANGNHPHGPAPTVAGINRGAVGREVK